MNEKRDSDDDDEDDGTRRHVVRMWNSLMRNSSLVTTRRIVYQRARAKLIAKKPRREVASALFFSDGLYRYDFVDCDLAPYKSHSKQFI